MDRSRQLNQLNVQIISGSQLEPHFKKLAELRIEIFRDYPYLYEGSLEYEQNYLKRYLNNPKSVLVLVWDQDFLAGAATGLALIDEEDFVQRAFLDHKLDLTEFFYFGESLLRKPYRGKGIGHLFFDEREKWAANLGFKKTCFCAVQRPLDHALRPQNYTPLDNFWLKRDYSPVPQLLGFFSWQDINQNSESIKTMQFWVKDNTNEI